MDIQSTPELRQGATMGRTLRENIAAMRAPAQEDASRRSFSNKIADRVTAFAGSMAFGRRLDGTEPSDGDERFDGGQGWQSAHDSLRLQALQP